MFLVQIILANLAWVQLKMTLHPQKVAAAAAVILAVVAIATGHPMMK